MLRVTVELVPFGIERIKKPLATLIIINDRDHEERPRKGNYVVGRWVGKPTGKPVRVAKIWGHARRQSPWVLIRKAIDATFR